MYGMVGEIGVLLLDAREEGVCALFWLCVLDGSYLAASRDGDGAQLDQFQPVKGQGVHKGPDKQPWCHFAAEVNSSAGQVSPCKK